MRIIIFLLSILFFASPLLQAEEKGNIQIYCQPDVKVFMNDKFINKTHKRKKGIILKNESYGTYYITLTKDKIVENMRIILNDTLVEYYSKEFPRREDSTKLLENSKSLQANSENFYPGDVLPEFIYTEAPEYPRLDRQAGIEGTVWISSMIGINGKVQESKIEKSIGTSASMDQSALEASYKNKFKPAIREGKPIAVWITYKIDFSLDK